MTNVEKLKLSTNKKLEVALVDLNQMKSLILYNKFFIAQFKKKGIEYDFLLTQTEIFKYRLFIGFLFADICCALNSYFNSKTLYEEKFAIRNVVVIINEGFKKNFNFETISEKGHIITKYRNNSFWIKEIKPLLKDGLDIYFNEYVRITEKLEKYLDFDFDKIKENRDLSIHYDKNPMLIYNMVVDLDFEEKVPFIMSFLDILDEMYFFTEKIGNHFKDDVEKSFEIYENSLYKK